VTIKIIADEESNFKALFYQDPETHMVYQAYLELIMIDATYKLVDLRLPLYLLMCVDGNGQSEIVGKCLFCKAYLVLIGQFFWAYFQLKKIFVQYFSQKTRYSYLCVTMEDNQLSDFSATVANCQSS